jgi:ABC-2 type transport system permease protein
LRTIIDFLKKEFLQLRRDPRMLPIIFIAPILQLVIIGYAVTFDVKNISLAICDFDRSQMSREFYQSFESSGYFNIEYFIDDISQVDYYLDKTLANIVIVIPKDFSKNISKGRAAKVQVLLDGADANSANISMGYTSSIVFNYTQKILLEFKDKSGYELKFARVIPETRVWFNPELISAKYFIPGVIGLLLTLMTVLLTAMAIVKEKEVGTLEQLIVTPIKSWELITGKLVPFIIIGFIDVLIVITAGILLFDVPLKGNFFLLLLSCIPFLFSTLGLGLFVSTISRTQQQAMMISVFIVMLPFIYLSGFTFPIENMPEIIQFITHFIPLKYFLIILRSLFLKGVGISEIWDEMLIMLAIGIVIFILSLLRFHKRLE